MLVVLAGVMLADSGAYFIGRKFGRHKLSPRLSPKKTWEGYFGGIIVGVPLTALLAALIQMGVGPASGITPSQGGACWSCNGACPHPGRFG